jgi:hypothetical protein
MVCGAHAGEHDAEAELCEGHLIRAKGRRIRIAFA